MRLEGAKAIADVLAQVWQRSVSDDSVRQYHCRYSPPLPYRQVMGRIVAEDAEVRQWAAARLKEWTAA